MGHSYGMSDVESASESASDQVASVVPELFYDLICRFPPGMLLTGAIAAVTLARHPASLPTYDDLQHIPFGVLFICFVVTGYVVGVLLTPIALIFRNIYSQRTWRRLEDHHSAEIAELLALLVRKEDTSDNLRLPRTATHSEYRKLLRRLHDELSLHRTARTLLPKMSAEAALPDNLSAACLVFIVAFHLLTERLFFFPIDVGGAAALIFLIWAGSFRYEALIKRELSFGEMVLCRKRSAQPSQA
jgi:hypothetical protein